MPASLVLATLLSLAVPAGDPRVELLDGVTELASPGNPGGVVPFGPDAWALVLGGSVPIAAAAEREDGEAGRVVALTHNGYVLPGVVGQGDTERFLRNAAAWLAGGKKKPTMAQVGGGACGLAEALGLYVPEDWLDADVLVAQSGHLKPERLALVRAFLADGGGLLCGETPWGWQELNPKVDLARDHTLNRLLVDFGLAFDRRFSSDPGERYAVGGPPPDLVHARRAFVALSGGEPLSDADRRLAEGTLQAALGCLQDHEPTLMLPLRRLAADGAGPFAERLRGWLEKEEERRGLRPLDERWGPWHLVGPFPISGVGKDSAPLGKQLRIEDELEAMVPGGPGPDLEKAWKAKGWAGPLAPVELVLGGRELDVGELQVAELAGRRVDPKQRAKVLGKAAAVFLYRRIEVDAPKSYTAELAADGGVGAWLDGAPLGEAYADGGMARLDVSLELEPGVHHLWVKLVHEVGNWRFRMGGDAGIDQALVDAASDRGVAYLVKRQHLDGSWTPREDYGSGYTAMVLYALAKSGLDAEHPVMRRGLAYLDAHPATKTYSLGVELLARAALDRSGDATRFQELVDRMVAWQGTTGMWAYPTKHEDLSNTLFAALALKAGVERGATVEDKVWRELIEGTFECHERASGRGEPPLGFSYLPRQAVTGSMTIAGLSCLLIAADALGDDLGRKDERRIDEAMERGLAWIDQRMVWDKNPNKDNWHYFWIYGFERLGALLDTPVLGGVPWYPAGAEYLIGAQRKDGHWAGGHPDIDTVLALLFLNRATAPTSGGETAGEWRLVASAEEPGRPVVRARLAAVVGEPFEFWVETTGDLDPAEVHAVSWVARTAEGERVLAVVDRAADGGTGRFASRLDAQAIGSHELVAKLSAGADAAESVPLALPGLYTAAELDAAGDQAANLLRGSTAGASSSLSGSTPRDAIDGKQGSNWILEPADREPRWWAELPSTARASRLVLVHRGPSPQHAGLSRVTRVRVELNGRRTFEVDLDPDPMRTTVVDFGGSVPVSRVELVPLGFTGDAASGFSEVLLLP